MSHLKNLGPAASDALLVLKYFLAIMAVAIVQQIVGVLANEVHPGLGFLVVVPLIGFVLIVHRAISSAREYVEVEIIQHMAEILAARVDNDLPTVSTEPVSARHYLDELDDVAAAEASV